MTEFRQLTDMIIAGEAATVGVVEALLAQGVAAAEILDNGLLPGMDVVGERMKSGEMFIPEVLLSARTMQACLDILKPHLAAAERSSLGTIVLATIEGDLHDIGKNIVALMLESAGFRVVNLGTGVSAKAFVEAVKEHDAVMVGMSALLTTTMPRMPEVIAALTQAGLRDQVKILIGGAPVSERYAEEIGADGFGANAVYAVERAKQLVSA